MTVLHPSNPESPSSTKGVDRKLPSGIWVLGFVSLFMDISSELVHSLLPILMTTVLGASMVTVGIIEGVAEGIAAATKVFSGAVSDYFRKRKLLAVIGYALGALTKPIFPLATTIGWVFGARFVDRIGKGIRGAPRDALIADITPPTTIINKTANDELTHFPVDFSLAIALICLLSTNLIPPISYNSRLSI